MLMSKLRKLRLLLVLHKCVARDASSEPAPPPHMFAAASTCMDACARTNCFPVAEDVLCPHEGFSLLFLLTRVTQLLVTALTAAACWHLCLHVNVMCTFEERNSTHGGVSISVLFVKDSFCCHPSIHPSAHSDTATA